MNWEYQEDVLSFKIIPFKIKGEIKAQHKFNIKKPLKIHDGSRGAFVYSNRR